MLPPGNKRKTLHGRKKVEKGEKEEKLEKEIFCNKNGYPMLHIEIPRYNNNSIQSYKRYAHQPITCAKLQYR